MDVMLGGILRGDPNALVVSVGDPQPAMGDLPRKRWQHALPNVADRIALLPRLSPDDYFAATALVDMILDSPHFSGSNTAYDAFSAGTPVVTLPGAFPRGGLHLVDLLGAEGAQPSAYSKPDSLAGPRRRASCLDLSRAYHCPGASRIVLGT